MRKIVYSSVTKFLAVVIFVLFAVMGCFTVTKAFVSFFSEEETVYGFEDDYTKANFRYMLHEPENAVYNTVYNFYNQQYDENGNFRNVFPLNLPNGKSFEEDIRYRLDNLYCKDKINYFVSWNGTSFTNCGSSDGSDLMTGDFYVYTARDSAGEITRMSSDNMNHTSYLADDLYEYDKTSEFVIAACFKDSYLNTVRTAWERQSKTVEKAFFDVLFCAVGALAMLVYLISVCGVKRDRSRGGMWLDSIWAEVHFCAVLFSVIGAAAVFAILVEACRFDALPRKMLYSAVVAVSGVAAMLFVTSFLSVVRNIKLKKLVKSSLILSVTKWILKMLLKLAKGLFAAIKRAVRALTLVFSNKTGYILVTLLLVYTALIGLCGLLTWESGFFLFFGIVLFVLAAVFVAYRANELEIIKRGTREVKDGNISQKIPPLKSTDMNMLADDINGIAQGLEKSMSAKLRAEKMKTELITNVSHDLKTPVTSIINYASLALGVENLPEQAHDYVTIIAKKGERLKNLTSDLFDISKAQSGNENVFFEKLDAGLLVNQALAEHDSEIKSSSIPFCVDIPRQLYICADGRKMSRVCANLIDNILKYSLKGTRAFVCVGENDGKVVIEFKNTASYHMTFDENEILSRFVRGDESRTEDGNGLGLAIAKSYTELCNGAFRVVKDGDLFKAVIEFQKYE